MNLQDNCIETKEHAIHFQHSLLTCYYHWSVNLKENVRNEVERKVFGLNQGFTCCTHLLIL